MSDLDTYLHILVLAMIVILAFVQPAIDNKTPKQIVSTLLLLLLGFMITHLTTHLLPNRIASFIYSSHHDVNAKNPIRG